MIDLVDAARQVQLVCEQFQWRFCFIGGLALQRWGEPRLTNDVDLVVLAGFGDEESYVDALLSHFAPRRQDAREFALRNRVLLVKSASGIGVDISLAAMTFEEKVIQHSSLYEYLPGVSLRTCSAEDLIILKSFAARGQDWVDVQNIIVRQKGKLDWDYIFRELTVLAELKEEPEIVEQLKNLKEKKKA